MTLREQILATYPSLDDRVFVETIILRDDSDGKGSYIDKWGLDINEYPLPDGLKVGKDA